MSIFGKLDAMSIPTNPFWIEEGEYTATVSSATIKTAKDNNTRQLVIEFTITDENSAYLDQKASKYFDLVDPELTEEAYALLPAEQKKIIKRNTSSLKKFLCGSDGSTSQTGLGVNADDLNSEEWNPEYLVGTEVTVAINNYGTNNTGVGVRWANLLKD